MKDILYLSHQDVGGLLPPSGEQLDIVERTLNSMKDGHTELPPKPAIHPRANAFLHAMPAYLGDLDVAALKWIGGSSANNGQGLPYLSGLIIVNDPQTAVPIAIIDAAEITAARTAAVTGVCVRRFARPGWANVTIIGYGVQGKTHARLLHELNPQAEVTHDDRHSTSSPSLVRELIQGADIVVTAIRFDRPARPFIPAEWVSDGQLVVAVDFDAATEPSVARRADLFVVDHLETFEYYRGLGYFDSWPSPEIALSEASSVSTQFDRVMCCNLGVATIDAAFAHAVLEKAQETGAGMLLRR